ncbi:MAG: ABC transporter C-terminal domain-containing protein, partial [Candidatus Eiseniibacteriota bacterium]
ARARRAAPRAVEATRAEDRRARAELQKHAREQSRIERDIETREERIRLLEQQLGDPEVYQDGPRARELVGEYERVRAELESLWQRIGEL